MRSRGGLPGKCFYSTSQGICAIRALLPDSESSSEFKSNASKQQRGSYQEPAESSIEWAKAIRSYKPREPNEIRIHRGEYLRILYQASSYWWIGENTSRQKGYLPAKYVSLSSHASNPDSERERCTAEVFKEWRQQVDRTVITGDITEFPRMPEHICTCVALPCLEEKSAPNSIGACKHDVKMLLHGSGLYEASWLKKYRLTWHPDSFRRRCAEEFRDQGGKMSQKLFVIFGQLIAELEQG
jgi:hypothetical protein